MTLMIILIFIPILVLILLSLNILLAPSKPDLEKMSIFECGMTSAGNASSTFQIAFYMVAILFLIFDLELLTIFPMASCLSYIEWYGFFIGMTFMIVLTMGFFFEYHSGVINFTKSNKNDIYLFPYN